MCQASLEQPAPKFDAGPVQDQDRPGDLLIRVDAAGCARASLPARDIESLTNTGRCSVCRRPYRGRPKRDSNPCRITETTPPDAHKLVFIDQ